MSEPLIGRGPSTISPPRRCAWRALASTSFT